LKLIPSIAAAITIATLASLGAAAPERVRIATIVTDRQGRAVAGLTLKDFELREDGVVQKIESVETRSQGVRRIAILLDEFHVDAADAARVRDAVDGFVRTCLRAGDALVVLKPLDSLTAIHLTDDRESSRRAIAAFEGRNGDYTPRNALEEETMGRAPALVEAGRVQVVLSALRALTAQLGSAPGRSAILLVSNGFSQPRQVASRGLPDVAVVERFANRYDVPIYAFDPRDTVADEEAGGAIGRLVAETGGTLFRGSGLSDTLARAAVELDTGYTLVYTPAHGDDGKFHPVQVSIARTLAGGADTRARAGYVSSLSPELRRALRGADRGPILPTRFLHRSPLIDVWSGVTRITGADGHIAVTWEPGAGAARPSQVALKATTAEGRLLFEGFVAPLRAGEPPSAAMADRAEFDAPAGRVQLDMTILGPGGEKLDVDARDIEVPAPKGVAPLLLPPIIIATQSAREFREIAADANAAPAPARQFRRTERLVIRVPAYASGAPARVTARLLNRIGQPMRDLDALPDTPSGVMQFDLPLAPLAPGDYFLQFTVVGPSGPVDRRVPFRITG
jgi:VWFA-related protein